MDSRFRGSDMVRGGPCDIRVSVVSFVLAADEKATDHRHTEIEERTKGDLEQAKTLPEVYAMKDEGGLS